MRIIALVACILLICGCASKSVNEPAAEIPVKVYFSDDFSSGNLSQWSVQSSGGGVYSIQDHSNLNVKQALQMSSSGFRSAVAHAPDYTMDWTRDYGISFKFMLMHRDNLGYTVYKDRYVELTLEQASGIACIEPAKKKHMGRFDTNTWNKILLKVRPQDGEYDVYLDGELKGSCVISKSDTKTFLLGDTDPTDSIYGDGLWDEFKITA